MDFKSLTQKLSQLSEQAVTKSTQAFDVAGKFTGEMLEKTAGFTYETLKSTPWCIATPDMFDAIRSDKNLVIFVVGDAQDVQSGSIIGRMPLLIAKAWQNSATLRIVYASDVPEVVHTLGAPIPSVTVFRDGSLKFQLSGPKLQEFLDSFALSGNW
jgi:hypothetical protein